MRNPDRWQPTKFAETKHGLRASRNPKCVAVQSRLITDLVAGQYERAIQAHCSGRLLDLGCGSAPLYAAYRPFISGGICADWYNTLHNKDYLDAFVDLNQGLPFKGQAFDTVLLTDVLEHIAEPLQLIREIAGVLRPGGKLIVGVPFLYWLHEEPHDYYRYTKHALVRFCNLSDLTVIELSAYGGFLDVLVDISCKGFGMLPAGSSFFRPVQFCWSALSRSAVGRKLSKAGRHQLPLGYVLVAQKQFAGANGNPSGRSSTAFPQPTADRNARPW